ncbi:flagellar basal body rod protein FlgB [Endozoicomonas sp. SM1973]|uniref:Flagellar basal body rod protein FlgB n=1 Tax=Spartinivicinus marinus TaxID=2994442 RepID=A0A853I6K5_9GAMM|nr:flagellar basal body rod protein FlgB [Spartinivicinus marinus]MCX4029911.1 flagellar basal body rod protein FlgB [Spartinivicinus marinus]NYZ64845.1 flagellar basal body rod protein FlgB [Spartinivicinus marinus]
MAINFDQALGIHPQALLLRGKRAELLADNLVNSDTPGFKARDIDFKQVLNRVNEAQQSGNKLPLQQTHQDHLVGLSQKQDADLLYRIPIQPAIDGNTVDTQQEYAIYARNAMDYQSSFEFLNSKFKGLIKAIKGQ